MVQSILQGPAVCPQSGPGPGSQCCTGGHLAYGPHRRNPGRDLTVSHNLLWRPWVTARISESLSNIISFIIIILNAIFFRSLKYGVF